MLLKLLNVSTFFIVLLVCSFEPVVSISSVVVLNGCCEIFTNRTCKSLGEFPSDLSAILSKLLSNATQDVTVQIQRNNDFKINHTESTRVEIPLLENNKYGTLLPRIMLFRDGVLKYGNMYYPTSEYCVDGADSKTLKLELTDPNCQISETSISTDRVTCIPKCCEYGQLLSLSGCVTSEHYHAWKPDLYSSSGTPISMSNIEYKDTRFRLSHHSPKNWCKAGGVLMLQEDLPNYPKSPFRILRNGQVVFKLRNQWPSLDPDSFCIDGFLPRVDQTKKIQDVVFHCSSAKTEAIVIKEDILIPVKYSYFDFLIVGCFTSALFVLMTIAVYILLWENQNIHGWTLLCSFVSLCCMYILIGSLHLYHLKSGGFQDRSQVNFCWSIGVALHFFYLSTFSWMTAVNFDLWSTFSNLQPTVGRVSKGLKRFLVYVIFALGIPLTIVTLSVTLDYLYRNDIFPELILPDPGYAAGQCFLTRNASLVYQYSPAGLLLVINLILFIITIRSVHSIQKTASFAVSNSSKRHKQSLRLFGKLFVIMGFSWGFEILSFFFSPDSVPWYWAVFDFVNVCHGLLIFIIFVCKKSTITSLRQKYACFNKMVESLPQCCSSCANACKSPIRISRSFTTTFSLSRLTKNYKSSKRKSSDSTEMSTVSA